MHETLLFEIKNPFRACGYFKDGSGMEKGGLSGPPFFVALPAGHSIARLRPLGYFTA